MKVIIGVVMVLSLAGSYLVGRSIRPDDVLSHPPDLATFQRALSGADPLDRAFGYHSFLRTLSPDDVDRAAEIIEAQRIWLSDEELQNFFAAWVSFDAPAAFEWAMAPHPGRFRQRALFALMFAWGFQDPPAALAAFKSLPRSTTAKVRAQLHGQLIAGWAWGEDKAGASDYIVRLSAGSTRQKATGALVTELMKQGPDTVIAWAESIPDDAPRNFKEVAFQHAANAMAIEDPVATAGWIEGHLDQPYSAEVPVAIGRRWIEQDPVVAMEWLVALPEGGVRDQAVSTAFRRWSTQSEDEAEQWLQQATPREALDHAVRVLVRRDAESAPARAVEWAARIENEKRRERALVGVVEPWYRRDPEAAGAWLDTSDLSPETQAAIRGGSMSEGAGRARAPRRR